MSSVRTPIPWRNRLVTLASSLILALGIVVFATVGTASAATPVAASPATVSVVFAQTVKAATPSGSYVRYSWNARAYRVVGGHATYMSHAQRVAWGNPTIHTVRWIPDSDVLRYMTSTAEVFFSSPGVDQYHYIQRVDWAASGYAPVRRFLDGFVIAKVSAPVWEVPDCNAQAGSVSILITHDEWTAAGNPKRAIIAGVPHICMTDWSCQVRKSNACTPSGGADILLWLW
ncbi:hypothetical protein HJC99_05010 [Candidatus Saccharibacteria bacterium]|nr:hypothetical protein [Candidatus Saccharibacteria bacterium]